MVVAELIVCQPCFKGSFLPFCISLNGMSQDVLALPEDWKSLLRPNTPSGEENRPFPIGSVTHYACGAQHLYYMAADHRRYEENRACEVLPEAFAQLNPQAAVIETSTRGHTSLPNLIAAAEKAAQSGFQQADEVLYTAHLAYQNKKPVIGGEPSDHTIFSELAHHAKDLSAVYLLRRIAFMHERGTLDVSRIDQRDATYLHDIARQTGIPLEYKPTFGESEAWVRTNVGKDKITQLNNHDFAPFLDGTPAQKLNHEIGIIREGHILRTITEALNAYGTVLVVYGSGHLGKSQDVFQKMFGAKGHTFEIVPPTGPVRHVAPMLNATSFLQQELK